MCSARRVFCKQHVGQVKLQLVQPQRNKEPLAEVARQSAQEVLLRAVAGAVGLFGHRSCGAPKVVDCAGWLRIDAEEQRRGAAANKPREKFTDVGQMLAACAGKP